MRIIVVRLLTGSDLSAFHRTTSEGFNQAQNSIGSFKLIFTVFFSHRDCFLSFGPGVGLSSIASSISFTSILHERCTAASSVVHLKLNAVAATLLGVVVLRCQSALLFFLFKVCCSIGALLLGFRELCLNGFLARPPTKCVCHAVNVVVIRFTARPFYNVFKGTFTDLVMPEIDQCVAMQSLHLGSSVHCLFACCFGGCEGCLFGSALLVGFGC